MENTPLQNKVITITEAGKVKVGEGYKMKIKGDDGKTYGFFLTLKAGGESVAYKNWQTMKLDVGSKVGIAYSDNQFTGRAGLVTTHDIRAFSDPTSIENQPQNQKNTPEATSDVWEAKDRLSAAQTALNATASLWEGVVAAGIDIDPLKFTEQAERNYKWLISKKSGDTHNQVGLDVPIEEDVDMSDLPF